MNLKSRIMELALLAHSAEQSYLARMSDEERATAGKSDSWGPKDVLAHMTAWKDEVVKIFGVVRAGEAVPDGVPFDESNAEFFRQHHDRSWEEILGYHEETHLRLMDLLNGISKADLLKTEGFPYQRGRPLWRVISGITYSHPLSHLRDLLLKRGDFSQAVEMQEQASKLLSDMDDDEEWIGAHQYNLACVYSLVGQKDKAVRILREALRKSPGLKERSKKDPDFDPIREHPDYKAIYVE